MCSTLISLFYNIITIWVCGCWLALCFAWFVLNCLLDSLDCLYLLTWARLVCCWFAGFVISCLFWRWLLVVFLIVMFVLEFGVVFETGSCFVWLFWFDVLNCGGFLMVYFMLCCLWLWCVCFVGMSSLGCVVVLFYLLDVC